MQIILTTPANILEYHEYFDSVTTGEYFFFFFFFFFGSRATCHLCPDHYIVLYNVGLLGRVLGCGTHSTISSDETKNLTSEISTECEPLPDLPVV